MRTIYRTGQVVVRTLQLARKLRSTRAETGGLHNALRKVVNDDIKLDEKFYARYGLVINGARLDAERNLFKSAFGFQSSTTWYHSQELLYSKISWGVGSFLYLSTVVLSGAALGEMWTNSGTDKSASLGNFMLATMLTGSVGAVLYLPAMITSTCTAVNYYYFFSKAWINRSANNSKSDVENQQQLLANDPRYPDQYLDSYLVGLGAAFAGTCVRLPLSLCNYPHKAASLSFLIVDLALTSIYREEDKVLEL